MFRLARGPWPVFWAVLPMAIQPAEPLWWCFTPFAFLGTAAAHWCCLMGGRNFPSSHGWCLSVGKECGGTPPQGSFGCLVSQGRREEFGAYGDNQTSWAMPLAMTEFLWFVLPAHPGEGESPTQGNRDFALAVSWSLLHSLPTGLHSFWWKRGVSNPFR